MGISVLSSVLKADDHYKVKHGCVLLHYGQCSKNRITRASTRIWLWVPIRRPHSKFLMKWIMRASTLALVWYHPFWPCPSLYRFVLGLLPKGLIVTVWAHINHVKVLIMAIFKESGRIPTNQISVTTFLVALAKSVMWWNSGDEISNTCFNFDRI